MSSTDIFIIAIAVLLPLSAIIRFVLLARWTDRLNEELPPDQHFQLIG